MPMRNLSLWDAVPSSSSLGFILLTIVITACSAVPAKYVEQAEPGVTLSNVTASPQRYRDKIVILGGVLVQEQEKNGQVWLHLKNRPLDPQFHPHRPISLDGPEAGHFWVTPQVASSCPYSTGNGRA